MRKLLLLVAALAALCSCGTAFGKSVRIDSFMPPNNLDKEDSVFSFTGIDQTTFNKVIDKVYSIYAPIISQFGKTLVIEKRWSDSTVNSDASVNGNVLHINAYGGLARRNEISPDSFATVLMHEIGHFDAGYSFYPYDGSWLASDEGASDYFTTLVGLRKYFATDNSSVSSLSQTAINKCKAAYSGKSLQVCYHMMNGSKGCADLLAALGGTTVNFNTYDKHVVSQTQHEHGAPQCRLDIYVAGILCKSTWDDRVIPQSYSEAMRYSCENGVGARPKCWFKD